MSVANKTKQTTTDFYIHDTLNNALYTSEYSQNSGDCVTFRFTKKLTCGDVPMFEGQNKFSE